MDFEELTRVNSTGLPISRRQNKVTARRNVNVRTWHDMYIEHYGDEFTGMSDGNLISACSELVRFCEINLVDFKAYINWAFSTFDEIFSPRFLMLKTTFEAYKNSLIPKDSDGRYINLATGLGVDTLYDEDGQVMIGFPDDGIAWDEEGTRIRVMENAVRENA